MVAKVTNISEVLTFHFDQNGRYLSHFIHFKNDTPKVKEETKTFLRGKKKGLSKVVREYICKRPTLRYSVVKDAEAAVSARNPLSNAIVSYWPSDFLDALDQAGLTDYAKVGEWIEAEFKAKNAEYESTRGPRAAKAADPTTKEIKKLAYAVSVLEPHMAPAELMSLLKNLLAKHEAEVVKVLNTLTANGRDKAGYIKFRNRK